MLCYRRNATEHIEMTEVSMPFLIFVLLIFVYIVVNNLLGDNP